MATIGPTDSGAAWARSAAAAVLEEIQRKYAIQIADDDIDGRMFATLGSLTDFVRDKTRH